VSHKIDRTLPAVLSGTMDGYQWFIHGIKYPTRDVLTVKLGERVETPHWHPEEVPSEKLGL
jgi:FtsP/CotA-like multicopper oxidase with cupredoxin domain